MSNAVPVLRSLARTEDKPESRRGTGRLGVLLTGGVVAVAIGGGAAAITDTTFLYSVPQVKYYSIDPADLSQDDPSLGSYARYTDRLNNEGSHQCFSTGVHLPTAAKVSALWVVGQVV